jgi:hypothetical protein
VGKLDVSIFWFKKTPYKWFEVTAAFIFRAMVKVKVKVKLSLYRAGQALEVPGG